MEISCPSKMSTTNGVHGRNYSQLDIKEKIKILHKINSTIFQKYSFDENNDINQKNKNLNLLSTTLPSSVIYKKKLVKHNFIKNSPNIFTLKISKSENKTYNKEKIIKEIKDNKYLRNSVKDELKNEIIEEFLEDIANIDEKNVMNFLKIKNLLISSEKIKKKLLPKYSTNTSKDISKDNSDILTNSKKDINSSKIIYNMESETAKKIQNNKLIYNINIDEIKIKEKNLNDYNENKKYVNNITPVKTIFNNLFINNNEKYIIKNPFHDHENKHINNIKRRKLFIQSNGQIQLSNFNFQIVNCKKNSIKNRVASYDSVNKNNHSVILEKENLEKNEKIKKGIKKNSTTSNIHLKNDKKIKYCFHSIINKDQIKFNKRYYQDADLAINDKKLNNSLKAKEYYEKNILKENKKEKNISKENKNCNNIRSINLKNNNIKIEDEKRKKLIKKIIEDSKKVLKNKNILKDNNYFGKLLVLKKNKNKNKLFVNNDFLNKSVITRKNKNINLNQINIQGFNTYTEHKDRNKTYSNFLNDKKSNIFRKCNIKKLVKVLKKENNKQLLNTKWLKNISKKNIPLLCFDKK